MAAQGKVIIFCADGTWNGPGEPDEDDKAAPATNVFKLFLNLDGKDTPDSFLLEKEQERVLTAADGTELQHAKYLHGVGNSDNFLVKILGGTMGAGLITRIVRGYTFISRNYVPGDRIILVGFSRGAYTARALAGLIAAKGLLDASQFDLTDKDQAYRLGSGVWYDYRQHALAGNPNLLGRLQERVVDLPGFFQRMPAAAKLIDAPIEAVAVWDTVGAMGIPQFDAEEHGIDAFRFADTKLNPKVLHGLHAIAVDEQRQGFTPTLWDSDDRITQILFPGAHADVGGGYAVDESGLSDCTLAWMTKALADLGVQFDATPAMLPNPDPFGTAHQPWIHSPWPLFPVGPRVFPSGLGIGRCLLDRRARGNVFSEPGLPAGLYAPANLSDYLAEAGVAPGVVIV